MSATATKRTPSATRTASAPEVASAREYLRANMPAIYRDNPKGFGMRFLGALEQVLDPQVAILDCLDAYLSPHLAPKTMVAAMAGWLGLPALDTDATRRLLCEAEGLARLRGTRTGIQIALGCCFPELRFTVEDHGAVLPSSQTPAPGYPGFSVRCEKPLLPTTRAAVRRTIDWQCPLPVRYELIDGTGGERT